MSDPIYVTKSFLPPEEEYSVYLDRIWKSVQLTNQGPLLCELEEKLKTYLNVPFFQIVSNGTMALQLALDAFDLKSGEIITTPFSYVATASSILWERCTPIFADIEPEHFCIDPDCIEPLISERTRAILPTHVFGYACDTERISRIANAHGLPVIYDGAHAFGCRFKGKSLLAYGDAATCSFHATKLFHMVEGGACIFHHPEQDSHCQLAKRFGHNGDLHFQLGINAKNSEFHAAMGLCNLKYLARLIQARAERSALYDTLLSGSSVETMKPQAELEYNYAYYPVLFRSEDDLLHKFQILAGKQIYPRRYFYPSLNGLSYLKRRFSCPVSEDVSRRIACLPLYHDLAEENIRTIASALC